MSNQRISESPQHLRPDTAAWYEAVLREFDLEEHHKRLLRMACEAWDAAQAAREAVAKHGMVYDDRFGQPRLRPEVNVERDARISFARLLRELAIDVVEPGEPSRPPTLPANAGRKRG